MSSKVFYYFCDNCGGDTATYEMYSTCPYCHGSNQGLRLIGDSESVVNREIVVTLENIRREWASTHDVPIGMKRKKRWFAR